MAYSSAGPAARTLVADGRVLRGRARAGRRLPPAALPRAARRPRARRRRARRAGVDLPRALALLPADLALAGCRRRGVRGARDRVLERRPDAARAVAGLVARAEVGLLDAGRRSLAGRSHEGPRRVDRARRRCVGCGRGARAGAAGLVGRAGRGHPRVGRAPALVRRARRPRTALQPLPPARRRGARGEPPPALDARGSPGARGSRRRREPADDEGQRLRLRHRPDASRRRLRHVAGGGGP